MAEIEVGKGRTLIGVSEAGKAVDPQEVIDKLYRGWFLEGRDTEEDLTAALEVDWLKGDHDEMNFLLGRSQRKLNLREYLGVLNYGEPMDVRLRRDIQDLPNGVTRLVRKIFRIQAK